MKKYFKFPIVFLLISSFIFSCSTDDISKYNTELEPDTQTILKLINGFKESVDYSINNNSFDEEVLGNIFLNSIEESGLNIIKNTDIKYTTKSKEVSDNSENFIFYSNLIVDVTSYSKPDLYLEQLETFNDEILSSNKLTINEKKNLVNKIAFMSEFTNLLSDLNDEYATYNLAPNKKNIVVFSNGKGEGHGDNKEQTEEVDDSDGWWDSWGRCAAGITGGAILNGTAGLVGGAAVGTITLPVIGTVSGAVVGGIGGFIGGGIYGAVEGCGKK